MALSLTNLTGEKEWWPRFFKVFGDTGIVAAAAQAAKVSRETVYLYKRENEEFQKRWAESEALGFAVLEDVATKRAMKSSDTLVIFLLKTRGRDKYGDVVENRHTGDAEKPVTIRVEYSDTDSSEAARGAEEDNP